MTDFKLWYLAHPLSAETPEEMESNRRNAEAWCTWVAKHFRGIIPIAPWVAFSRCLEETPLNRSWGLSMDKEVIRLCEGVILCGGRVSAGMREELASKFTHQPVIDLTAFAYAPPQEGP